MKNTSAVSMTENNEINKQKNKLPVIYSQIT